MLIELSKAIVLICSHCRAGLDVVNGEWHEITLTATATMPEERCKVYCLASPLRALQGEKK